MADETESSGRSKKPRGRLIVGLVVIFLVAPGSYYIVEGHWPGRRDSADHAAPKPIPVSAEPAIAGDFSDVLAGLGTVEALNSVTVRAQISGQIQRIAFKEGQLVKAGDPLVEIDPRPLQAALDQATARLAQDRSSLKDARTNLDRYNELAKQQFVARQQLDTQAATVSQGESQIRIDEAAIENARAQLGYASIRAPMAGRVGFRLVDVGNLVGPSDTVGIVTIQQVRPISVVFTAPQERLGDINAALGSSPPSVTALGPDAKPIAEGRLRLVNNIVDTASGTVKLKAVFPNDDDRLWPGLSVSTRMPVSTLRNVTMVPALAVQRGQDGLFVYVVDSDGKAEIRKVTLAGENADNAVIAAGVKPGETVVTSGQYRVQPGTLVAVNDAGNPPGADPGVTSGAPPRTAEN